MKTTVDLYAFRNAFFNYNRGEQFSYEALVALFDHLTDYEDAVGEEIELDVVAICCDCSEDTADSLIEMYNIEVPADADEEQKADIVEEYLEEEGFLVSRLSDNSFVYRNF